MHSRAVSNHSVVAVDCGMLHGPPNTLLAARRAVADGATALNIDLVLTKDERLVGAHSSTHWDPFGKLAMLTDPSSASSSASVPAVSEMLLQDVPRTPSCDTFRRLWSASGVPACHLQRLLDCPRQRVSTLEDFLRAFPASVPFHVELKAPSRPARARQLALLDEALSRLRPRRHVSVRSTSESAFGFEAGRAGRRPASRVRAPDECGADGSACHARSSALLGTLRALGAEPAASFGSTRPPLEAFLPPTALSTGWLPHRGWRRLALVCDVAADYLASDVEWREQHAATACLRSRPRGLDWPTWREQTPLLPGLASACAGDVARAPLPMAPAMLLLSQQSPAGSVHRFQLRTRPDHATTLYLSGRSMRCATKMATSMLVVRLMQIGLLGCRAVGRMRSLDEPLLPHLQLSGRFGLHATGAAVWRNTTLRQVMAGVALLPASNVPFMRGKASLALGGSVEIAERGVVAAARAARAGVANATAPRVGRHFVYSNVQWALVERLIEVSTGVALPRAARVHLFEPAGVSQDTYFLGEASAGPGRAGDGARSERPPCSPAAGPHTHRYERNLRAAVGLCATAEDLLRLARVLTGAATRGTRTRLLSPASVSELLRDQLQEHFPLAVPSFLDSHVVAGFRSLRTGPAVHFVGRSLCGYHMKGRRTARSSGGDISWLVMHGGATASWAQRVVIRVDAGSTAGGPVMVQNVGRRGLGPAPAPELGLADVRRFERFAWSVAMDFANESTSFHDLFCASGAACVRTQDRPLSTVVSADSLDGPARVLTPTRECAACAHA